MNKDIDLIKRGEIYFVDLGDNKDSIQSGIRPCIIVANNLCNRYCRSIQVVPVTSNLNKKDLRTHVKLYKDSNNNLTEDSLALCESVTIISTSQIIDFLGTVTYNTMKEIDIALKVQLGLIDMDRVKMQTGSLKELEHFIIKNKTELNKIKDVIKIYLLQKNDLDKYCNNFGYNYSRLYTPKLKFNTGKLNNSKQFAI